MHLHIRNGRAAALKIHFMRVVKKSILHPIHVCGVVPDPAILLGVRVRDDPDYWQ